MRYLIIASLLFAVTTQYSKRRSAEPKTTEIQWLGDGWTALEYPANHFVIFFHDQSGVRKAIQTICTSDHVCAFDPEDWQARIVDRTPKTP